MTLKRDIRFRGTRTGFCYNRLTEAIYQGLSHGIVPILVQTTSIANEMPFDKDRYEIARGVLPEPLLRAAQEYFNIVFLQNKFVRKDLKSVPGGAWDRYCDALATTIQERLHDTIEERTGLKLLPTYNYTRIYPPGTPLMSHTDRPACEISATLTIQNLPDETWPIFLRGIDNSTMRVDMNPGDMLIYRGMELPHWREPGRVRQTGIFMHWVDANGPHVAQHGDPKRRHLSRNLGILGEKRTEKGITSNAPTFSFD